MINALLDMDECQFSEHEIAAEKQAIAQEKWNALDEDACEFLLDNASDYIIGLARGGDHANEIRRDMERNAVAYLAQHVPTAKAIRRLRP